MQKQTKNSFGLNNKGCYCVFFHDESDGSLAAIHPRQPASSAPLSLVLRDGRPGDK